jgi:hypothetical protein
MPRHRVEAAFLYKFAAYVEWPQGVFSAPASPIVIGVAGADDIARELEHAVVGRQVAGRPLRIKRLDGDGLPRDCCHILFVGRELESGRARELLSATSGRPVLTVTEAASEQPRESVINFLQGEERVRFDISREAAERNGLRLGSRLLSVARQVASR